MSAPTLAERATQRRALNMALDVRCPRADHWHARRGVPCIPPDAEHEWGQVCIERHEVEASTREERAERHRREAKQLEAARRQEWRESREATNRARIAACIAQAARRPTTANTEEKP